MIKLSKKAITAISCSSAAIITGGTVTASVLIKSDKDDGSKPSDPSSRGKDYHHYSIISKLKTNQKLSSLISLQKVDNSFFYIIDEIKFKNTIKTIIQETFQTISVFSTNWNNYKIEVSYKVEDTSHIKVDLVWYLPNTKIKYYDQFVLILEVT